MHGTSTPPRLSPPQLPPSPLFRCLVLHMRAVAPGRQRVRLPLFALPVGAVVADICQEVVLRRQELGHGFDQRVPHLILEVAVKSVRLGRKYAEFESSIVRA